MTRNEPLTITDFDFRDGTPLDQMRTPTMNEFTVALAQLHRREAVKRSRPVRLPAEGSSVVERQPEALGVAGPTPAPPTISRPVVDMAAWSSANRRNTAYLEVPAGYIDHACYVEVPAPDVHPLVYGAYPRWKYHALQEAKIVNSEAEERALGVGWGNEPVAANAPCVIDRAACIGDAIFIIHGLRLQYLSAIPDAGYRKLMDAEDHLNKKLSAYLTGKADL